jgi:hypothetical protein
MGHHDFPCQSASLISIERGNGRTNILKSPPLNDLLYGISELSVKHIDKIKLGVNVSVKLSKAGIDAVDDIAEILVDDHRGGAEDNEVEVEDGEGLVEVRLLEDIEEDLLDLTKVDRYRAGLGGIDPAES